MTSQERRERERERLREMILEAANQVASEDGIDNLSIRKIANKIEYSPASIYHYFRDKEEIVDYLLKRGYQKILRTVGSARDLATDPEQRLREFARGYIHMALANPDEYRSFLLSSSPGVLEQTAVLFPGVRNKRPTMVMLCQSLKEFYHPASVSDERLELTAQVIWSAAFGLIIRSIIEGISPEQVERLIDVHSDFVVNAIRESKRGINQQQQDRGEE